MTDPQEKLQELIAGLLDIPPAQVTADLSLDVPKFRGSVGTAILSGAIVARLGRRINTRGMKTYGELLAAVTGRPAAGAPPAAAEIRRVPLPAAGGPVPAAAARLGTTAPAGWNWELISCGTDIEEISIFPETNDYWNHDFYKEHFTPQEIAYCVSQAAPREHFAARWCAKEALKKTSGQLVNLPFSQIQVGKRPDGSVALQVRRNDAWVDAACRASLSHTPRLAIAMVIAFDAAAHAGEKGKQVPASVGNGQAPLNSDEGKLSAVSKIGDKKRTSLLKRFFG